MATTRIASFLTGSEKESESRVTEFPTSRRVREAQVPPAEQQVPLEELMQTMREAFMGDHERVSEARFAEMVDIMAEQKQELRSPAPRCVHECQFPAGAGGQSQ